MIAKCFRTQNLSLQKYLYFGTNWEDKCANNAQDYQAFRRGATILSIMTPSTMALSTKTHSTATLSTVIIKKTTIQHKHTKHKGTQHKCTNMTLRRMPLHYGESHFVVVVMFIVSCNWVFHWITDKKSSWILIYFENSKSIYMQSNLLIKRLD